MVRELFRGGETEVGREQATAMFGNPEEGFESVYFSVAGQWPSPPGASLNFGQFLDLVTLVSREAMKGSSPQEKLIFLLESMEQSPCFKRLQAPRDKSTSKLLLAPRL